MSGLEQERRSARRFEACHAARLQFVTPVSDLSGVEGPGLWPTLTRQTRDISESGLGLLVPALREDDENFFGVKGPVLVTLALPSGAVSARAVAVRYERLAAVHHAGGDRQPYRLRVQPALVGDERGGA